MYFEVFSERDGWRHCRLKQLFRERNYWLRQIDTPYWSAGTRHQMLVVLDSIRQELKFRLHGAERKLSQMSLEQ